MLLLASRKSKRVPMELSSRFLRSEHWPTGIEIYKEQNKTGSKGIEKLQNGFSCCYAVMGTDCHLQDEESLPR